MKRRAVLAGLLALPAIGVVGATSRLPVSAPVFMGMDPGGQSDTTFAVHHQDQICELIVFDRQLSPDEHNEVYQHLCKKWGAS